MIRHNIISYGPNINKFFDAINYDCEKGWHVVPGTMYITSVEVYVEGAVSLPNEMKSRKLEIIAFVTMEK